MKHIALAAGLLGFLACASSTGVMKMGPDTYTVTTGAPPIYGGVTGARERAYKEAGEHCSSMGKEVLVKNESTANGNTNGAAGGQATLTFRCLNSNDAELAQRPNYERPADITVQSR